MDNESLIGLQLNLKRSAVTVKCCVCCKTEDHDRDPHGCSHMVSVWPSNEHLLHMGNPFSGEGYSQPSEKSILSCSSDPKC